jgi:hypothetical protein
MIGALARKNGFRRYSFVIGAVGQVGPPLVMFGP